MTIPRTLILPVLFLLALPGIAHAEKNLKAHVHGNAQLTVAMENDKSLQVDLDVPADSIIGFEHQARSEKDQKAQTAGLNHLEKGLLKLIEFPASFGCKVSGVKVGMETEAHEEKPTPGKAPHGEHSDVNASYTLTCDQAVSGTSAKVGLIGLFPKIKAVSVKVLGSNSQTEKKISKNGESLEF